MEALLSAHELFFQKNEAWIDEEKLYEVLYTVIVDVEDALYNFNFTQEVSETGYLFKQTGYTASHQLATGEFIITASQDTELVITTLTRIRVTYGAMATFVNDNLLTIQSDMDGEIEKRIVLKANEPVTVFVENFSERGGSSNYGTPSEVLFNADCSLEIIKNDNRPFHRIYTTEDCYSYGASDLRILLENYVFNELPAELKQGVKTVVNSQSAFDIDTAALVTETTQDKLWVPSYNEWKSDSAVLRFPWV